MSTYVPASQLAAEDAWFKSSYSDGTGNSCVEVANRLSVHADILIRDSKDKSGPALHVTHEGWGALLDLVRSGDVDFGVI
ncbi:DUF397 domain-containing protein [Actinacidiphila sp. bgisy144]|uniref:DUF397 domain-containing protein n=1 Tax=unclassified Actinacidiphila TaxID=2995708 RepID=UPI003EBF4D2E